MNKIVLKKDEAKEFLMNYHGLSDNNLFKGKEGVIKYINRVGCIQYDPLNVVGRNPDLVLQSRVSNYKASILEELLYTDRLLVDGWDKMMSIYSQSDWKYFSRIRNQKGIDIKRVLARRGSSEALKYTKEVIKCVKEKGPILPSQIKLGSRNQGGRWGHKNLSSATMDYLFNIGVLGIYKKKNTQKIYDLVENLLPSNEICNTDSFETDDEFYKWYIKRRIGSVGLLWARNGGGWLGSFISNKELRMPLISRMVEENELISVGVENIEETFFIRKEDLHILNSTKSANDYKIKFLAPLDNLLWDRDLVKKIFDFSYSWEVYTPVNKRKYGYYVLPVAYNNKLVARFEPELNRGKSPLAIKNWWWEDKIKVTSQMREKAIQGLKEFSNYLGEYGIDKDNA